MAIFYIPTSTTANHIDYFALKPHSRIMFRFTLLPLVFFFGSILLGLIAFYIYRKIKNALLLTYKKSAELAAEKQQEWKDKELRKQFPEMLKNGFEAHDKIEAAISQLPEDWGKLISPLSSQAKQILDEIAFNVETSKGKDIVNAMRTFFIHTLDALHQFVDKIAADAQLMNAEQIAKAHNNISLLEADLAHHQTILDKKRKFDFDVLMDVIKARLKR